jgi:hypothetical protein
MGYDHGTIVSLFITGKHPQDVVALLTTLRLEFSPRDRAIEQKVSLTFFPTLLEFSKICLP